jgi:two-component system cell cycle sensor histidine kinase/response regulator CckA
MVKRRGNCADSCPGTSLASSNLVWRQCYTAMDGIGRFWLSRTRAVIRDILRIVLKRMGHVVLEACDGQEGLTISRKFNERIDLVISDIRMPKMDGPTMVRHLQADRPDVKVSLTSGYSDESVPNDLMKDFLHKPFLPTVIEQKVHELLACEKAISTVKGT